MSIPSIMIFFGALLVAAGGLWAAYDQNEADKKLRKQNELISDQNSEIAKRNEAISNLLDKVSNSITGGDSYLSFSLQYNPDTNLIDVSAFIEGGKAHTPGKYSLSGLSIEIKNHDGTIVQQHANHEAHLSVVSKFPAIALNTENQYKYYQVVIFAKNGQYGQHFLLKKHTDGVWHTHSLRFNDLHNVELREEEIPTNYPEELKTKYISAKQWRDQIAKATNGEIVREQFRRHRDDETHYGL